MNHLFSDKWKNTVAISFTVFYLMMLILNLDFNLLSEGTLRFIVNSLLLQAVPFAAPLSLLWLIMSRKVESSLKKWLLPLAFGAKFLFGLMSFVSSLNSLRATLENPMYLIILCLNALSVAAFVLVIIGTLFDFKYIKLLKYGSLALAVITFISPIIGFIIAGGFEYLRVVPSEFAAVNWFLLIKSIAEALFYLGIFILTTNKKTADPINISKI